MGQMGMNYLLVSGEGEYQQETAMCQECLDKAFRTVSRGPEEYALPSDLDCEYCGKKGAA